MQDGRGMRNSIASKASSALSLRMREISGLDFRRIINKPVLGQQYNGRGNLKVHLLIIKVLSAKI